MPNATSPLPSPELKRRALRIAKALRKLYPRPVSALDHASPFQLLIATILSAQCTDAMVNHVTPDLFRRFPDAPSLAAAPPAEVEKLVHRTGFFRRKAASIRNCARQIAELHGGVVPASMEELVKLAGVGRKTANVVRGHAMALPGVTVDTHVKRLSGRLALTGNSDPEKIERDLMALLPPASWTHFTNALIWHGRRICTARSPKCPECVLLKDCPTGQALLKTVD